MALRLIAYRMPLPWPHTTTASSASLISISKNVGNSPIQDWICDSFLSGPFSFRSHAHSYSARSADSRLFAVQNFIALIVGMSGVGEYIEKILGDMEDLCVHIDPETTCIYTIIIKNLLFKPKRAVSDVISNVIFKYYLKASYFTFPYLVTSSYFSRCGENDRYQATMAWT